jgi:hypothetical protein
MAQGQLAVTDLTSGSCCVSTGLAVVVPFSASGPAIYKLLLPHYVRGAYLDEGLTVTEGVQIPSGWVPTLAVDPLNNSAVLAFFNAGPRDGGQYPDLSLYQSENFARTSVTPPATYWVRTGVNEWSLTGLGIGLGPVGG